MRSVGSAKSKKTVLSGMTKSTTMFRKGVKIEQEQQPTPLKKDNEVEETPEVMKMRKIKQKEFDKKEEEKKAIEI
jgi:predicted membrane GTPase involved in stress response